MQIEEQVTLAPYTTFKLGGKARYFARIQTPQDLEVALAFARERTLPLAILGGGSNVLIADAGFDGLVLKIEIFGITQEEEVEGQLTVKVGAGESWDGLVQWSLAHGSYSMVDLSGIPGTVGGAIVANAGAYGEQCSDYLLSVEVFDREKNVMTTLQNSECEFSYHDSIFGKTPGRYILLQAVFALSLDDHLKLSYQHDRSSLERLRLELGREPKASELREAVLAMREKKGYLVMDGHESYQSAGSFFHMPFVSAERYEEVRRIAQRQDKAKEERLRPWAWEQPDGSYKLAPGFLLEFTQFQKGYRRGNVGISPKHILSIVNFGNATSREVAALAQDLHQAVKDLFDVDLVREAEYLGEV